MILIQEGPLDKKGNSEQAMPTGHRDCYPSTFIKSNMLTQKHLERGLLLWLDSSQTKKRHPQKCEETTALLQVKYLSQTAESNCFQPLCFL